jgi:transposase
MVEEAMRQLPDRSREVLVLREQEGLSYREIADLVGLPMGTVMSTLSRARERFRHALSDLWRERIARSHFKSRVILRAVSEHSSDKHMTPSGDGCLLQRCDLLPKYR